MLFTGHAFHTFLSLHRRAFRIHGRFPDTTLNVSMLNVREITIRRDTLDALLIVCLVDCVVVPR